jgi:transcriptional regulator with XRE-family HTH domain
MLKELRIKAKLTQAELARKLNVTQSAVSAWEKGDKFPRKDRLRALCKLLDCKVDDLL